MCRYIFWPRHSLEYLLVQEPYLANVLNIVLGRDITNKLYALNERVRCVSNCFSLSLCLYPSVCLCLCVSFSVFSCLTVSLSFLLPLSLPCRLSLSVWFSPSSSVPACLFHFPSLFPSFCLCLCLVYSVRLSVCLPVCLCVCVCFFC